jgi:hypothetical protein
MASARDRIDRWLGELLATTPQGDGAGIVLIHAAVDQTQRVVKSWKLGEAVENLDALVNEIDEIAEGDAEGLGGRQRYVLRAQVKGKEVGSLTLRYEYRPEDGPAIDSEPATPAGTIAVLQRHAEGAMRMMVQSFGGVIESYKEQVNAQKALIADFQRQAAENFRLQEELASRKIEQELLLAERKTQLQLTAAREASEIEKEQLLWGKGLGQLLQWAPVILHYLTKGQAGQDPSEVVEAKRRADEERLFASVDDATIEGWRQALPAEQFAVLIERLNAYRRAKTGEHGAAPAGSAADAEDATVAAASARLYTALVANAPDLGSVAVALLGQRELADLGAHEQQVLQRVAGEGAAGAFGAVALWSALRGRDVKMLVPLVEAIRGHKRWSEVGAEEKIQLMSVVRRAIDLATRSSGKADGDDRDPPTV